jgi:hypothetical protein
VGDVLEARLRWTIHDAMAPGYFWYDQNFFKDGILFAGAAHDRRSREGRCKTPEPLVATGCARRGCAARLHPSSAPF